MIKSTQLVFLLLVTSVVSVRAHGEHKEWQWAINYLFWIGALFFGGILFALLSWFCNGCRGGGREVEKCGTGTLVAFVVVILGLFATWLWLGITQVNWSHGGWVDTLARTRTARLLQRYRLIDSVSIGFIRSAQSQSALPRHSFPRPNYERFVLLSIIVLNTCSTNRYFQLNVILVYSLIQ